MKSLDAIIVGGGPAGSAAAIYLRRGGKRVLLLEKESAPHHKVCGEFISYEAAHYLSGLGINLEKIGAEPIGGIHLVHGNKSIRARLPFQAYSLSRRALDEVLLDLARAEGAEVLKGFSVTGIAREAAGWCAAWAEGEARANALFLATGKHDVKEWRRPCGPQNDFIAFKMHYVLRPDQAQALLGHTEVILFRDGYAGLQPVEKGTANFCLVVRKSRFVACGKNWGSFLKDIFDETPHLADRLSGAAACWPRPLAIYRIPYGFIHKRPTAPPGLYRLGDQMGVIPSFAGEGIAIALHTASLAAAACLKKDSKAYHNKAARELMSPIRYATGLRMLTSSAVTREILLSVCHLMPSLLPLLAKKTRLATICA